MRRRFPAYFFCARVCILALEVIYMRLLTAKQTAELLQVTLPRVYELARTGLIPSVRMGRQIRFNEEALRAWAANGGSLQTSAEREETRQDAA
jgi:excisionase family DNA binding protein